jgi:hydroxyacyl-ACP dehydratase HTD2-like protein with hotdog domain
MSKTNTKKRGRGKPPTIAWNTVGLLWKNHTNREIADKLGCTQPSVFVKRRNLIANAEKKAIAEGKDVARAVAHYTCNKPAYTRSRSLPVRVKTEKTVSEKIGEAANA